MNSIETVEKLILLSRQIQEQINADILQINSLFIISAKHRWISESLSLLAKQSNLFKSCILLLENNMEQEAFILARSQFNNMLWISYLCNDYDGTRVKEYFYESQVSQLIQLQNIKKFLEKLPDDEKQDNVYSSVIKKIKPQISSISDVLKAEGYNVDHLKSKSIFKLANNDNLFTELYLTFYHEASKFEHADISTVENFRKKVSDDCSVDIPFSFYLSQSDIHLWKDVFKSSLIIIYFSVDALYSRIINHEKYLFETNTFNEKSFHLIISELNKALDLIDGVDET